MNPATLEEQVSELLAREQIRDVIGRYCYGMDSRNWEMYRSCWADEIEVDLSDVWDRPAGRIRADDWVDATRAFFSAMPHSQHIKLPVDYDIRGDEASVVSVLQGKHWMPNDTGDSLQTMVGYYRDGFVRTAQGWKMSSLEEIVYWNEGNSHVLHDNAKKSLAVLVERYG
jgi:hypothetical protein